jgi:hypothetical protein
MDHPVAGRGHTGTPLLAVNVTPVTVCAGIRHFVMAITVMDKLSDPCSGPRGRFKILRSNVWTMDHSPDYGGSQSDDWNHVLGNQALQIALGRAFR